jgi:hypothetical protein
MIGFAPEQIGCLCLFIPIPDNIPEAISLL